MADVMKRVVGPIALGTTAITYYTVAAGVTTAVRNIHVVNYSASPVGFSLNINGGAGGATGVLYSGYIIPVDGAFDWSGFMVLAAGDYLSAAASVTSSLALCVSGVESS